ncbi:MAG: cell wall hydrolase [Lachnospiraceae bacterium]|nr:cell wall hydrolase [Lachnospiraceae bacterium]
MIRKNLSKIYKALSIVLALSLLTGGGLHLYASSTTREELNNAQQQANEVQSQITQGKEDLENLENEKDKISGQLSNYNDQLTEAVNDLNNTEQAIDKKELEIAQKQRELDTAKGIEEKQYNDLVAHMQYMYESGLTQSYLNLVSESTSLTDFLNISEYVEQISAYDTRMLTQFKETREFIEAEEATLQTEHEALEALRASQEANRTKVSNLVSQTQNALSNKEGEITQKENEVTAQEEQLATIKDNIAALQQKLAEEIRLSQEAANAEWRDISQVTITEEDITMLANLIYCEARGESYEGKLAVASVVINRILSSKYPDTMAGVIYQKSQFAPVTSTKNSFVEALAYDKAANSSGCYEAAREAAAGITNVSNCVYFQTLAYLERVERLHVVRYAIGNHGFY